MACSDTCSHSAGALTIGYQGAAIDAFLAALRSADIKLLVDVRAVPWSRRPGYAKSALTAALAEAGIAYRHMPALGNPKAGRDAARSGRLAEYRAIYARQLATPEGSAALAEIARLAAETRVCLMCFERYPRDCHRGLIVAALPPEISAAVKHLAP